MLIIILSLSIPPTTFAQGYSSGVDSTVTAKYLHAVELFNEHDDTGEALAEAKNEFTAILSLNPHHAPSLAYLGMLALDDKNLRAADSLFSLALASDSTCAEARVGRAWWYRQRGLWQTASDEIRRAVVLAPGSAFARRELINGLLHRAESPVTDTEIDEAIPHLQKLLEMNPDDRDAHHDLAQSYEHKKLWKDAAFHYREVLRIGQLPEDMDVWVYLVHQDASRCLEESGEYQQAADELKLYLAAIKEYQADDGSIKEVESKIKELENKARK